AAFLVALLEEDLRGSERLSVLFHRRQGALRSLPMRSGQARAHSSPNHCPCALVGRAPSRSNQRAALWRSAP
ncbi:hypothetical protein, partial [Aeromonas dhakensis]|uniref:hypothetical protein n=1 Tax=Aeromonas dhakensis TaxID=196024 RepID=UPI0019D518E9